MQKHFSINRSVAIQLRQCPSEILPWHCFHFFPWTMHVFLRLVFSVFLCDLIIFPAWSPNFLLPVFNAAFLLGIRPVHACLQHSVASACCKQRPLTTMEVCQQQPSAILDGRLLVVCTHSRSSSICLKVSHSSVSYTLSYNWVWVLLFAIVFLTIYYCPKTLGNTTQRSASLQIAAWMLNSCAMWYLHTYALKHLLTVQDKTAMWV